MPVVTGVLGQIESLIGLSIGLGNAMVYYRTIRKGTVKIVHTIYVPSSEILQYDGRLDGMRYVFWGTTEKMNMAMTELAWRWMFTPYNDLFIVGPENVDGLFPWRYWYPKR